MDRPNQFETPATDTGSVVEPERRPMAAPDAGTDAPGPVEERIARKGPGKRVRAVVAVLVIVGAVLGGWRWWSGRAWETTDNAQIGGHVIPISARVGGYVIEVRFDENQRVREGDTLVVLDDRDFRQRLAQAEAEVAGALAVAGTADGIGQAAAQASAAAAAAEAARAAVRQAEAHAERTRRDVERYRPLVADRIVSQQQLDAAVAASVAAEAQVVAAREQSRAASDQAAAARAGLNTAQSRLEAVTAVRDNAALQLSYTRVIAPAAGVLSRRSVEAGQMVQPGQPIGSLVLIDSVWVVANLKETQVRDLEVGDPAEIRVDAYPGQTFRGEVETLSPATGATFALLPPDNATGNFTKVVQRIPVRIRLLDPQDPERPLRPGMSAEVRVRAR
jgi:membrane fusion protein (multidrug efflux system)